MNKVFTMRLPDAVYQDLQQMATRHKTTVPKILRVFIRLGLLAMNNTNEPKVFLEINNQFYPIAILMEETEG